MFDRKNFVKEIQDQGYSIIENVLTKEFIEKAKNELGKAIDCETEYHKGKNHPNHGMVLLCSLYNKVFTDLFDNDKLTEPFNSILGEGSIVYAYTSSSMPPSSSNYSQRIHVDCPRVIPNYITNMGATILLDDFTEDNGATWFLPASHQLEEKPEDEFFYKNAKRLIAKAGSVWFFNARVWHAGGVNQTDKWRHALTINACRSWMKQRIDIPRAMEHFNSSDLSEKALQKLGFFAQVPASYDEYFAPLEKRKFKQKTE